MIKVLVMTESKEFERKSTKKGKPRKVGLIKIQVISNLKSETINEQVQANISEESTLITDDCTSYAGLEIFGKKHQAQEIPNKQVGEILLWVNIAICNAKRMLLYIHHNIKPKFLKEYLNKLCYKLTADILAKLCSTGFYWLVQLQKMNSGIKYDNRIN